MLRILTPSLGAIALLTTSGSFALNVIFAVELSRTDNPPKISAIVASALLFIDVGALPFSIFQNVRNHHQSEKKVQERRTSFTFLAALALTWFLGAATTLATLVWMERCLNDLPTNMLGSPTRDLLVAAFTLCGAFALINGLYLFLLIVQARRSNLLRADAESSASMQQTERPMPAMGRYSHSTKSSSPPSSPTENLRRSNSDAISSIRSSFSQSIRPMTSKTRLLSRLPSNKSSRSNRHVPPAIDTNLAMIPSHSAPVEDGFDSWDTSAVSQDSRQTISESSPQSSPFTAQVSSRPSSVVLPPFSLSLPPSTLAHSHSRTFLPTIPASPVCSRTPSPAFALDPPFKPVSHRPRNRSQSPANSFHSSNSRRRRSSLVAPPSITDPAEAHIHPLFRSDSPTPAPAVSTPGTSVMAAPNAGQLISENDRASLRRMRSESVSSSPQVSSPLVRLNSSDSMGDMETSRQHFQQQLLLDGANRKLVSQMERSRERRTSLSLRSEERDSTASDSTEGGAESESSSFERQGDSDRKTSASIPDFVLGAAPRNSLCGYQKRQLGSTSEESDNFQDGMI